MKGNDIKNNNEPDEVEEQINKMLSFGSVGLGLNRVEEENPAETRLKEDIRK